MPSRKRYDAGMRTRNLLLAAGLAITLGGCATTSTNENTAAKSGDPKAASTEQAENGVVCKEERQTGSMVYRRVCRPADDADRRNADQESMRRSQVNTRRGGPPR
jgi:hypothetical protein